MKKMIIFEPAMCCSTGVCGPSVDPELLRISTALNNLKNKGIEVERYNLNSNPQMFLDNKVINQILTEDGVEKLPVTLVDDTVVKIKAYPTNEELCELLGIPEDYLKAKATAKRRRCGCKDGSC
ncbi:arsenite efflux transporter metallochaperone ArsD [Cellulosilyticum sp. I15G10I2]|uniref:arsenite efflux transporter metallochaperone ArsD n=1 Tax=Cellulosilyticum sp. I15G10I2 TaxID=1892843 RepID=UPI00085BFF8F|nr:arsenite efflux transporter metallochaperone ArsD [Cellulosilyticum sp. I15G10I2]